MFIIGMLQAAVAARPLLSGLPHHRPVSQVGVVPCLPTRLLAHLHTSALTPWRHRPQPPLQCHPGWGRCQERLHSTSPNPRYLTTSRTPPRSTMVVSTLEKVVRWGWSLHQPIAITGWTWHLYHRVNTRRWSLLPPQVCSVHPTCHQVDTLLPWDPQAAVPVGVAGVAADPPALIPSHPCPVSNCHKCLLACSQKRSVSNLIVCVLYYTKSFFNGGKLFFILHYICYFSVF